MGLIEYLKWNLSYGEQEQIIKNITGGFNRNRSVPEYIKNKPTLDIALIFIWDSFLELDSERKKDFGKIPWGSIKEYCLYHKVSDFDGFRRIIRRMDSIYLEHQSSKVKKK